MLSEKEARMLHKIAASSVEGLPSGVYYVCGMGHISTRMQTSFSENECLCSNVCEPHIHEGDSILCLHDGETDHSHCPNPSHKF